MGYRQMFTVRASGMTDRTQVDVLEAIAFFFNEKTGQCYPSTDELARISRVNSKLVRKTVRELEEAGLVSCRQQVGRPRFFTLHLEALPPAPEKTTAGQFCAPRDETTPLDDCHPLEESAGGQESTANPGRKIPPTPVGKSPEPRYETTPLDDCHPLEESAGGQESTANPGRKIPPTPVGKSPEPRYETTPEQGIEQGIEQGKEQGVNAPAKNSPVENLRLNTNPNPPSLFAEGELPTDEPPLFDDFPPMDDPEGLFAPDDDLLPEADPDMPVIATEAQPGPESEEGTEAKEKPKGKRKASDRGCTIPFATLPDEWRGDADELAPELDPDKCWVEFKDYWRGVPGAKGRKAGVKGWRLTWRNNLRKLAEWNPKRLLKEKTAQSVLEAKMKEYEGWLTGTI